jgi:hypothetical protein
LPICHRGWGVTLVRPSDGKRVDLLHSRPIEPVRVNQDTLPWFAGAAWRARRLSI